MLNDFVPVIHRLPAAEYNGKLTIIPLADAHYGSPQFNETRWHDAVKRIQDDPFCFCVLVGDMLDTSLKSSVGSVYEATASPSSQKEWLADELSPISGKVLAACDGNHERRVSKEADQYPLYDVMVRLGIENVYRPNICFMQIRMTYPTKGRPTKSRKEFSFAITHGSGGGQYIGSSANKVQSFGMAIEGIDCLITGHTHKPVSFPVSKLVFEDGHIFKRQFVVAVASSFLDYGGYPVQKMMPPTAHTTTEIILGYTAREKSIRVLQ